MHDMGRLTYDNSLKSCMVKELKLLGLLLVSVVTVTAQNNPCVSINSPVPRCISVMDDGSVEVDFNYQPFDSGAATHQFGYYILNHANSAAGPWTNGVDTNFVLNGAKLTHTTANGQTVDNYYKIQSFSYEDCDTSKNLVPSNESAVIRTIRMTHNIVNDSIINLSWNEDGVTQISNPIQFYDIFKTFPAPGTPILLPTGAPFTDRTYSDIIITCQGKAAYRTELKSTVFSCTSVSSTDSVDIEDNTPPFTQALDTVSFDELTGFPLLGWRPNEATDVEGYVITEITSDNPTLWNKLDTVFGRNNTSYLDSSIKGAPNCREYYIYAFDFCGNTSSYDPIGRGRTICVTSEIDICNRSVELLWNPYESFASGTDVLYKIYASQGASPFLLVGTTVDNFYTHTNPAKDVELRYIVRAFEKGGSGPFTSSSHLEVLDGAFLNAPDFSYISNVSVVSDNEVRVKLYTDPRGDVSDYILKRTLDTNDVYQTIGIFRAPSIGAPVDSIIFLTDEEALANFHNYYYQVQMVDSCGEFLDTSTFASSMYLKISANSTKRENTLTWTNYVGFEGDVAFYRIWRGKDGVYDLIDPLITVFPDEGPTTTYVDNVFDDFENSQGQFCYYVVAHEGEETFRAIKPEEAISNEVCVNQQPFVSIPKAFTPNGDGLNDTFKPVFIFTSVKQYEFSVYNRAGEILFKTNSLDVEWDGTIDGKLLPTGVYIYKVKFESSTGEKFDDLGSFTIVR